MTSHRSSPRPHLPHLAWIVSALLLLSLLGGPATSAPPALTLHSPNPGALHLTWPAVTPAPPAYHVRYAPADTPLLIKEATSSTHTLTLYDLEPGVLYTVQVRAGVGPWSVPVLQRIDDYRADPETVGTIGVGAEEAGYIESAGDTDWFFVDLAAGEGYPIEVTGAPAPPLAVYDATGGVVQQGLVWHHASALTFTPAIAGLYHVAVGGPEAAPGYYTLTVDEPPTPGSRRSRTLAGATPTATPAPQRATTAPAKPRGLTATASHDQVVLTWDDPQDASITGYVILRRVRENDVGGEFSVLVADTGSAATTYTDDTVVAGTTYTYRIKAINAHGVSERSRWFHIDIPAAPEPAGQAAEPPAKPTGLSATATHNTVVLTWDDPGDASITGYVILRRVRENNVGGAFSELVPDTGSAVTTYTDDTVQAATTYTYRIKAINEYGVSERSRWFHIDTPAAPEAVEGDDQDGDGGGAPGGPSKKANVSEGTTDCAANATTICEVDVGGSVTGNIGSVDDVDYFRVVLEAGTRYQIDLEGADTGRGTLADPALTLYDESENNLLDDDNSGIGANSRGIFTPTTAGTYYLRVEDAGEIETGTYTLSVIVLGANGASEADTDFPTTTSTTGRVDVGASVTGNIENTSDSDSFLVDLETGKVYQFDLEGAETGRGTLSDPGVVLYDAAFSLIDFDDDGGEGYNSRLTFESSATGTYLLKVEDAGNGIPGTYTLSVREIPPCTLNTGDIWCGVVTVGELRPSADALVGYGFADSTSLSAGSLAGNPDDTMFSVGDNDYTIQGAYVQVPTGANLTGTLYVLLTADLTDADKAGLLLPVDGTATPFEFSGALKGTTGLYSWGLSGLTWSAGDTVTIRVRPRTLSVADASDAENDGEVEFTVTLSEAAATAVTATWTASIETGDTAVAADLGTTKTGTVTVAIGDTTGTFEVPVVNDADDEGDETFTVTLSSPSSNAKLETDPTATGTIEDDDATAPPDDPADPPEADFREGDTDLPADTTTTGVVEVGGFGARGAIHEPNAETVTWTGIDAEGREVVHESTVYDFDTDWFAVVLEAGGTYRIDMKGQILSSPGLDTAGEPVDPELTLRLPQINAIYDADGDYLFNTWSRDESSAHHLFRVTFHAHAGGTYYIAASGESFEWGGYELTVIEITEDTD